MKYLLLIAALLSTPVLAKTMTCSSAGYDATFIIKDGVLLDTNENVLAAQIAPNQYSETDRIGTVTYTVQGDNIIMKFDTVTKVYTCQ